MVPRAHTSPAPERSAARGFTLIELLVTIGVTTFISALLVVYGSASRSAATLSLEQAKLAQVIARAKALAISTYVRVSPPCGYGVRVLPGEGRYELFSYTLSTRAECGAISETGIATVAVPGESAEYEVVEVHILPSRLRIDDTSPDSLEFVLFLPPDPTVLLFLKGGGDPEVVSSGTVRLTTRDGSGTFAVTVGSGGDISF
ncbi:MAG: prepilin-type N-terminal cleavage/methylation domain-containing protein [Candidatus Liptonbacteria bacterium]|nr:prepilin-type N-terminal cleavage/methylation domain-containing protein [Candidatus Liptonbacteria bacterium]